MKRKLYTRSHDIELLKPISNNDTFTADEHAYIVEKEFSDTIYKTKESLLRHYLPKDLPRLSALSFLIERVSKSKHKNILSLGAGPCVLEYLLKLSLPEDSTVVATDFDAYIIGRAKTFFPEISTSKFDFFNDNIADLQSKLDINFDIAIFFASAYVMDDGLLIKLFRDIKDTGVKEIIDFHAGYMDLMDAIFYILAPVTKNPLIRKLFRKPAVPEYIGKFHGYSRTRSELRRLYRKAGLEIYKELSVPDCKYVAILG